MPRVLERPIFHKHTLLPFPEDISPEAQWVQDIV